VPIDRLICGDVGYGKTEIALRAAFKAVQDCKQVAVLVPTALFAQQDFTTFPERYRIGAARGASEATSARLSVRKIRFTAGRSAKRGVDGGVH